MNPIETTNNALKSMCYKAGPPRSSLSPNKLGALKSYIA